jgi:hypothetical protein
MFDLNRELRVWRTPFRTSHIYSVGDIEELESHLVDAYEAELERGLSDPDAFWMAVARVGSEGVLRSRYQQRWRTLGTPRRYWRTLIAEATSYYGRRARWVYASARTVTLLVGVLSSIYLYAFGFFLTRGSNIWEFGRPVYEQGVFITLCVGMMSVFTWIPFRPWESRVVDWLRLGYCALIFPLWLIMLSVVPLVYHDPSAFAQLVAFGLLQALGPALWLSQVIIRRHHHPGYEELLSSRTG